MVAAEMKTDLRYFWPNDQLSDRLITGTSTAARMAKRRHLASPQNKLLAGALVVSVRR